MYFFFHLSNMQYNQFFLHKVFLVKLTFLQKNLPIQHAL